MIPRLRFSDVRPPKNAKGTPRLKSRRHAALSPQPAENIRVVFQSAAGGDQVAPVAMGLTDKNGEYSLRLAQTNKKGVVPGPYAVFLSWSDPNASENPIEGETEAAECPYNLPPRANSGELRFEVGDKGESAADFTFDSSEEPANVPVGI